MSVQSFLLTVHLNRESNLESKTLTTSKLKELQGPKVTLKLPLLGATIPPNLMQFRCTVMEKCRQYISQHTCMHDDLYQPCTFAWGQRQTLTTPNLKELQGPKVRLKLPLLAATIPPNLMRFRLTVMEKCRQYISQHTCMHDDLYHPCTFAWGQSQTLTTPNLKELQRSKSRC